MLQKGRQSSGQIGDRLLSDRIFEQSEKRRFLLEGSDFCQQAVQRCLSSRVSAGDRIRLWGRRCLCTRLGAVDERCQCGQVNRNMAARSSLDGDDAGQTTRGGAG